MQCYLNKIGKIPAKIEEVVDDNEKTMRPEIVLERIEALLNGGNTLPGDREKILFTLYDLQTLPSSRMAEKQRLQEIADDPGKRQRLMTLLQETVEDDFRQPGNSGRDIGDLILGRYEILAFLGEGGMGIVYKCLDRVSETHVAVKTVPPVLAGNPREMEKIRANYRLVESLAHPNIVIHKGLDEEQIQGNKHSNYYLIMEYCQGKDLSRWAYSTSRGDGVLTPAQALPVLRQIADALDFAHSHTPKVIHRDIKPANVIVDSKGGVKVIDFGIAAQIHSSLTRVTRKQLECVGTPVYMAPEQWEGQEQDAKTDQYALGVIAYELLAGRLPFDSPDFKVLRGAVLNSRVKAVNTLSVGENKALRRALSKNPEDRFENCTAFIDALKKGAKSKTSRSIGDLILGRYEILAFLGEGGMGIVYKCLDRVSETHVAVKTVPPVLAGNPREMEKIRANYRLVESLAHPNIVIHKGLDEEQIQGNKHSNYYLIMEYCQGKDLSRWAYSTSRGDGVLTPAQALPVLRQIADALDFAHSHTPKVIHRDIKPANVIVDSKGGVKVIDFGIAAQIHSSLTRVTRKQLECVGTPVYMAPEQWEGQEQDAKTDQYALGVIAYELLAGRLPFDSPDFKVLRGAVLNSRVKAVNTLSVGENKALRRALSKNPEDRFENCTAFIDALERNCTSKKEPKSKTSRSKGLFFLIACLLLAILFAGARTGKFSGKEASSPSEPIPVIGSTSPKPEPSKPEPPKPEPPKPEPPKPEPPKPEPPKPEPPKRPLPAETAVSPELRSKIYLLQARILRKKNRIEKASYDRGQGFGKYLDALTENFDAGGLAVKNNDIATAGAHFRTADEAAQWIFANALLREQVQTLQKRVAVAKGKADFFNGSKLADGVYKGALEKSAAADQAYGTGEFSRAIEALKSALSGYEKAFEDSRRVTLENKVAVIQRVIRSKEWDRVKELALELKALDPSRSAQFISRAEQEKKLEKINLILAAARSFRDQGAWQNVYDYAAAALKIDSSNSEARSLKDEAERNLKPNLEIIATVNGVRVPATVRFGDKTMGTSGKTLDDLVENASYTGTLSYKKGESEYTGNIGFTCNWKGLRKISIELTKVSFSGVITLDNGVKIEMVKIDPGTFIMGTSSGELGRDKDETQHQVTLSKAFWLGKFEVTQAQYEAVMGKNPSDFRGSDRPVEKVTWYNAKDFCSKLNKRYARILPQGYKFDLPSEAQWEYACRAGENTALNNGKNLTSETEVCRNLNDVAWYNKNTRSRHEDVGLKQPNNWGLYDMHGNVREWCRDWLGDYSGSAVDPEGPASGTYRVNRGGCWGIAAKCCRSGSRNYNSPDSFYSDLGFRLALVPEKKSMKVRTTENFALLRLSKGVKLEMVKVKAGFFTMGSPAEEHGRNSDEKQHKVTVTEDFWMGKFEVTQAQWKALMEGKRSDYDGTELSDPARFKSNDRPVESVSWHDAMQFCNELNRVYAAKLQGKWKFTLPTEAQWEYACRAGTETSLNNGINMFINGEKDAPDLDDLGWYGGNCGRNYDLEKGEKIDGWAEKQYPDTKGGSHAAGNKEPNRWDFYDMHGNVSEWCRDKYGRYSTGAVTDPVGPNMGAHRVFRGGSWSDDARHCRSANRAHMEPGSRSSSVGFRLVLVPVH